MGADLDVGAEAARLRVDLEAVFGVHADDAPFLRDREVFDRFVEGEFVGRKVVGDRRRLVVVGRLAVAHLDVGAVPADAGHDRFAFVAHAERDGVDHAGVDVGETGRHLLLQARLATFTLTEVEAAEPRLGLLGTGGDLVEVVLHLGGEGVVDEVGEVAFHDVDHREGGERRHEGRTLLPDVAAVLDGADDRCVGRRTPNAEFLEAFDERRLREATRRRRGVPLELERAGSASSVALDEWGEATFIGIVLAVTILNLGLFVDLTEAHMSDHGARRCELNVAAVVRGCAELQRDGLAGAVGHLRRDGTLPDQFVRPRFGLGHLLGDLRREPERVARRPDRLVGFLRVLRLRGVVAGRVGEEVRAVALRDHRAGGLQCRVRQRGAVGSHIGDVALFVEALGSPHRHLRAHPELAARLLLVGRGDERCGGAASVGLRLTSADLVGHAVERADQLLGPGLVEHGDVVASEATVITEVATARQPNPVDRVERRRELALVVTLRCSERAFHIPVAGLDERHAFAFTFDDDAGGDRLHTAGRQLRHHLLPEHRADLVAVKAVEDAAGLLGIDHLAVEFARRLHGKLDGVLGDLVEHHPLDGHVGAGVEHLDQVPGDRLTLTILIGCEIELVGLLQQRLQETNVILLVAVLHVQRLEPVVDVDAGAGPRFTLVGLRHVGGVARQVADVADRRLDRELGTQVLLDLLGLGRALDDDERIGHQWVSAGSG